MTAKEYLSQAKIISARLRSMARNALSLQEALKNVSPKLSDMPRSVTPDIRKMEKLVATKVDLDKRMESDAARLAEITDTINSLSDPLYSTVLVNRYIACMSWMEIAIDLGLSESYLFILHRDALAEVEKFLLDYSKV